jgi:hypothetical protein
VDEQTNEGAPPAHTTVAEATELALGFLGCLRDYRAKFRVEVQPQALLLDPEGDPGGVLLTLPMHVPDGTLGATVREMASAVGARYVILVIEGWGLTTEGSPEKADEYRRFMAGGGRAVDHPDRIEVLLATLSGPGVERAWRCEIAADGSVGEPKSIEPPKGQKGGTRGTLVGLAGRQGEN